MRKVLVVFLITFLMGASTLSAQETTREEAFSAAVHTILEQYSSSLLAGDSDAWIELWDDNAVQMPNSSPMAKGKARIKNRIENILRMVEYRIFDIQITELHLDNNLGYVFGNYREAYTFKGTGVRVMRSAKYVAILKEQDDGGWKIILDCSNLNN